MSAVLVVDYDARVRERLVAGLAGLGFAVASVAEGRDALELLRAQPVDAIVLEVDFPTIDGIALIPLIRRLTAVPIIMLAERMDLATRIAALAAGADDCVRKPFDIAELAARINSALRRPLLRETTAIAYADLSLDVETRRVRRGKHDIETTAREFNLLLVLARHPGHVFTRTQLIDLVWGTERDVRPGTVETLVSDLRCKIDRPPLPRMLQTVRGLGYTLRLNRPDRA